jgi:broad specificity phosphatase PhoE
VLNQESWVQALETLSYLTDRGTAAALNEAHQLAQESQATPRTNAQASTSSSANACRPAQLTLQEAKDQFVRTGLKEINFGTFRRMVMDVVGKLRQREEEVRRFSDQRKRFGKALSDLMHDVTLCMMM